MLRVIGVDFKVLPIRCVCVCVCVCGGGGGGGGGGVKAGKVFLLLQCCDIILHHKQMFLVCV